MTIFAEMDLTQVQSLYSNVKKKRGGGERERREKEDVTEGHKLCWILTDCSLALQEQ